MAVTVAGIFTFFVVKPQYEAKRIREEKDMFMSDGDLLKTLDKENDKYY